VKWGHGHSLGIGALLGLSLASHGWLIFCLGIAGGWFGRDFYSGARYIARRFSQRWRVQS
jgi:hypothetical protein